MARIEKWDEVHGNQAPDERMMAFLDSATDQYAILQLRRIEDAEDIRDLQRRLDELWEMQKLILKRLSGIR